MKTSFKVVMTMLMSLALLAFAAGPALAVEEAPEGDTLQKKIDELVKQLGSDEWSAREEASKKLVDIGEPAIEALVKATKSGDTEMRMRAKKVLEQLHWISPADAVQVDNLVDKYAGKADEKLKAEIDKQIKALKSADEDTHEEAADALEEIGKPAMEPLKELAKSADSELADRARDVMDQIEYGLEAYERDVFAEIKQIASSDFYLVRKLAPGKADEKRQGIIAEVLSGMLNLSLWNGPSNVVVRGGKLVVGDQEFDLPPGAFRLVEKGDKIFVNGQEYQLQGVIEKGVTPAETLGKLVAMKEEGNFDLSVAAVTVCSAREETTATPYLMRVIKGYRPKVGDEKLVELCWKIMKAVSKFEKEAPSVPESLEDAAKMQSAIQEWQKWWKKEGKNRDE